MKHIELEDTVYFWFAANATSGSGDDGASAVYDVREGGAAAGAAPTLSGNATLLSHANYPAGAYEVAVAATGANGFAANKTYGVFCTLAVDSQNPTGFIGDFTTSPVTANVIQVNGDDATTDPDISTAADRVLTALPDALPDAAGGVRDVARIRGDDQSAIDLKDFADAGYDPATNKVEGVKLVDTTTDVTNYHASGATAAELAKVPKSDSNVSWNATAAAQIQSEANDALVANHLDHLLAADYDPASKPGVATALLNELVENDGGVSRYTANALEQAPTPIVPTAESIADAVWDESATAHVAEGSTGKSLADILVDTAEIGAAGAGLTAADDAVIAAIAALSIPTAAQNSTAVWTTALTEAYRATGATGTGAQLMYEILANLINFGNAGTLKTVTKLDKSTTAKTYTYDDADSPTAIEETT